MNGKKSEIDAFIEHKFCFCKRFSFNFDQLYRNVNYLNVLYGGQYPKVNYAIYTNGYLDQWLYQGITHTYDANSYAVNVPGYARWADATSMSTFDSIVLNNAKYTVVDTFRKWYYNTTLA